MIRFISVSLIPLIHLLSLSAPVTTDPDDSKLEALIVIFRHGNRTPLSSFPTDPYKNESYWPDGWGQLTNDGKRHMFYVGKLLAKRYKHFLPTNLREVYVRSSDSDRCLESASLVLAGSFPPKGHWTWNKNLDWVPFPIHSVPKYYDGVLNPSSNCPAADKEMERIRQSPVYQNANRRYKDVFDKVSEESGLKIANLLDGQRIFDTLKIQSENHYEWPVWVKNVYPQLSQICDLTFELEYSTKLIKRLRTGLLLKEIQDNLQSIANKSFKELVTSVNPKLFFYSTHDSQLAPLLSALQVFNNISPPYGAALLIELHKASDANWLIKLAYMNETQEDAKPYPLSPPFCETGLCHLESFSSHISDYIPTDWWEECKLSHNDLENNF